MFNVSLRGNTIQNDHVHSLDSAIKSHKKTQIVHSLTCATHVACDSCNPSNGKNDAADLDDDCVISTIRQGVWKMHHLNAKVFALVQISPSNVSAEDLDKH